MKSRATVHWGERYGEGSQENPPTGGETQSQED
jgi:hypothetical protein